MSDVIHDIGWAVARLREGKRVTRPNWKVFYLEMDVDGDIYRGVGKYANYKLNF